MKDFNEYHVASITDEIKNQITNLEKEIKDKSGKEVVLIAYQEKSNPS